MSENCQNCGAPKRGSICSYCGTHFSRYQGEATVEVEHDIVNIYSWDGVCCYRFVKGYNVDVKVVCE